MAGVKKKIYLYLATEPDGQICWLESEQEYKPGDKVLVSEFDIIKIQNFVPPLEVMLPIK